MEIPNAPTDSLYKFLALVGIFILVATPIIYQRLDAYSSDELRKEIDEFVRLKAETYNAQKLTQRVKGEEADVAAIYAQGVRSEKRAESLRKRFETLRADANQSRRAVDKAKWGLVKLRMDMGTGNYMTDRVTWYGRLEPFIILLGLLTSISGFGLWYFRLQRYVDAAVRREADKLADT